MPCKTACTTQHKHKTLGFIDGVMQGKEFAWMTDLSRYMSDDNLGPQKLPDGHFAIYNP